MKETAQKILDVAQELVRSRGYSAFSYADISERVGIRKASIHYHFSSKEELTRELVKRYQRDFQQALIHIDQTTEAPQEKLRQFLTLYQEALHLDQMCLCGMLSAELVVLPASIQSEVKTFFSQTEAWLKRVLQAGAAAGHLRLRLSPSAEASLLLATVQGAQLIARASENGDETFAHHSAQLIAALCSTE